MCPQELTYAAGTGTAGSPARRPLNLTRRVTLEGHLHPVCPQGRRRGPGEKREGTPEEAERNT